VATIVSTPSTGTVGATVTAATWGVDFITNVGAGTATYVTGGPHNNTSAVRLTQGTGALFGAWTTGLGGAKTDLWWETYLRFTGYPTSSNHIVYAANTAGTTAWSVDINGTGQIVIRNAANAAVRTSTAVFPLNTWVRLEGHIAHAAGTATTDTIQVLMYNSAESATATEDSGVLTSDLSDQTAQFQIGAKNATPTIPPFDFGDVTLSTTKVGPLGTPVAPPPVVSAGSDVTAAYANPVTLAGAASAGTGATLTGVQWTQLSGPACTITNGTTLTPTITPPAGQTPPVSAVFQLTATEA
jgi:hypothetical protein